MSSWSIVLDCFFEGKLSFEKSYTFGFLEFDSATKGFGFMLSMLLSIELISLGLVSMSSVMIFGIDFIGSGFVGD